MILAGPVAWWRLLPASALIAAAVAVVHVLGPVFATPQMTAVGVEVLGPTALISGLLAALGVSVVLREPVSTLTRTGPRPVRAWRTARVLALVALTAGLLLVTSPAQHLAAISCTCALTGQALITARVLWDEVAWALPLLHVGMTITFGTDPFGTPHPWAWILTPEPSATHLTASLLLLTVGTLLCATHHPDY